MTASSVDCIKKYQNEAVVSYFHAKNATYSKVEVEQLFIDLLAWMWLHQQRLLQGKLTFLFGPLLDLDEIWHIFILHTQDYTNFCTHYFGTYFHHHIEPLGFERQLEPSELEDFLQDCFTYLGQAWVERRFAAALNE